MGGQSESRALQQRVQPGEPARRHRRGALAPCRGGQHHRAASGGEGEEIMRRRGDFASPAPVRPAALRIGRLSQGPGSAMAGQTPSASPPSTAMSTLCSIASCTPQMATRGCPSLVRGRRTTVPASSASSSSGRSAGRMSGRSARRCQGFQQQFRERGARLAGPEPGRTFCSAVSASASAASDQRFQRRRGVHRAGEGKAGQDAAPAGPEIPGRIRARFYPAGSAARRSRAPGAGRAGPASPGAWHGRGIVRAAGPAAVSGCFSKASSGSGA